MGEVYHARDARLARDVAIKVIPEAFSADADRLQRFEQEARATAGLNHPNILAVYDVGIHDGSPFIVSELLEGETLRERLAAGPLPVRKAIELCIQIAQALAAAHEKGIIHRDLKPENIFVNKDGRAKVLDFGLAKLTQADAPLMGSSAPTSPGPNKTQAGLVLGTIGYMAPEQVRGQAVDHRADVFAFGAVLYEMLSGGRAFKGETTIDTMTSILKEDPEDLPVAERRIPPALARIVDRCLEKNAASRFHSMHDLAIALETLSSHSESAIPIPAAVAVSPRLARRWVPWALAAVTSLAAIGAGGWSYLRERPVAPTYRATLLPPEGVIIGDPAPSRLFALSPDGRRLAFVALGHDRRRQLWVRSLNGLIAQPLAGTEDALSPFWSPDSNSVGFYAPGNNGTLKKIDVDGGPPITLCRFTGAAAGADWNASGDILFTTTGAGGGALYRVSASGGEPSVLMAPDAKAGETDYWWPFFLPDGRHFLYLAVGSGRAPLGVYVASLDSSERTLVMKGGSNAKYAQGHLVFMRGATLMAQPFDADRRAVRDEAVPIAEKVQSLAPTGAFSVSQTGALAYASGEGSSSSALVWFDAASRRLGTAGQPGSYADLRLSPDGKRAAVTLPDAARGTRDVWLFDTTRDLLTRFTFDPAEDTNPVWSPDGQRIVFASNRSGNMDLYEKEADGAGTETVLLSDKETKAPLSWSSDGRFLLYAVNAANQFDLWVLPLTGDRKPFPFVNTPFAEVPGEFSPDGRWVAYTSNESGRPEVYVAAFPGPGGKWQVSTGGGTAPSWRRDGREIFYSGSAGRMMAAPVTVEGPRFDVGAARPLFEVRAGGLRNFYDVTPDSRFLVNLASDSSDLSSITLVVNWAGELETGRK